MRFRRIALAASAVAALAAPMADSGCLSAPSAAGVAAPVPPKGCTVDGGAPPPTAPGGYYTNGATVCTADGTPHLFHGVDRPSLEWNPGGENLSRDDFKQMASWGANVVRIALNQDFWLSGAMLNAPDYPATVAQAVTWAEAAGLDVILDLHWSDAGDLTVASTMMAGPGNSQQQTMADANSIEFWKEVADRFQGDGRVLFELYNEPHDIGWDVWLNGGQAGRFVAAGMQQLHDAVRSRGANNVVIAGGLNYAYDLSGVGPGRYVHGYNIMYATHPYSTSGDAPSGWETSFGHLQTSDFAPVIVTEFGDGKIPNCTGNYDQQLIAFTDQRKASWTAWAWFPGVRVDDPQGCHFPSLIVDWSATPSVQGVVVKAALQGYPRPTASTEPPDAAGLLDGTVDGLAGGEAATGDAVSADDATLPTEGGAPAFDAADNTSETSDSAPDSGASDGPLE